MKLDNIDKLIIGTRSSPLALAQTQLVVDKLEKFFPSITQIIEIKKIKVSGDIYKNKPLRNIGGKGLFTKEIDQALIDNKIDIAVHSMKDVDSVIPSSLVIAAVIEREDPREFLLSKTAKNLKELNINSIIGTSSLRRKAQLQSKNPGLIFKELRGNILKRIEKLNLGEFDATILAYAGLKRLGIKTDGFLIGLDIMLPCVAQGIVGITVSEKNYQVREIVSIINHQKTLSELTCERALLTSLGATCNTPVSGLAKIKNGQICMQSEVYSLDGKDSYSAQTQGGVADAKIIGSEAGKKLIDLTPKRIIESWKQTF